MCEYAYRTMFSDIIWMLTRESIPGGSISIRLGALTASTIHISMYVLEKNISRSQIDKKILVRLPMTYSLSNISSGGCSCTVGYICGCFGVPPNGNNVKKRGYTYNGPRAELPSAPSKLMTTKLNPQIAAQDFLNTINTKSCCKEGQCLKTLYEGTKYTGVKSLYGWADCSKEGYGKKFLDAVVAARQTVYVSNQNRSVDELGRILFKDLSINEIGKIEYRFYHQGVLGDAPEVPIGVRVRKIIDRT